MERAGTYQVTAERTEYQPNLITRVVEQGECHVTSARVRETSAGVAVIVFGARSASSSQPAFKQDGARSRGAVSSRRSAAGVESPARARPARVAARDLEQRVAANRDARGIARFALRFRRPQSCPSSLRI